jgi:hypothetical protein
VPEGDACQRLSGLLRDGAREAHRGHRAGHQEWSDDHRLPGFRVLEQRTQHAVVVSERAVHVDEADHRRCLFDLVATAEQD